MIEILLESIRVKKLSNFTYLALVCVRFQAAHPLLHEKTYCITFLWHLCMASASKCINI